MPFEETRVMDQRQRFVHDAHAQLKSFSDLCSDYGISRKTGYKWLERWITEGPEGLRDRPSRPRSSPIATAKEVVDAILEVRRRYSDFGPKKVAWHLERNAAGSRAALVNQASP